MVQSISYQHLTGKYVNGTLRECNSLPYKTATHIVPIDMPESQQAQFQYQRRVQYYPEECVFGLDGGYPLKSIQDSLHDQMNNATLYYDSGSKYVGEPWLKILYNDSNLGISAVNKFMDGLATSMGVFMRTAGTQSDANDHRLPINKQFTPGHALNEHTCIRVHWKFLSFPAILLVAELFFFGALVILNWRNPWDGNWKSATIPLLFQDVTVKWPENGSLGSLADETQLNQMVKHVEAKLIQDDDDNGRWKLTTVQDTKER